MMHIDIQLFAKASGAGRNGRDSRPKYLGIKKQDGEQVIAGNIIRQREQNSGQDKMWMSKTIHSLHSKMELSNYHQNNRKYAIVGE